MNRCELVAPGGVGVPYLLSKNWNASKVLQVLQEAVDGYIEAIYIGNMVMIINEEGRIKNLMHNEVASKIAGQRIVGTVVVMKRSIWESYNE